MFRCLLSCASIFVLVITTLLSPATISARRCGERMPVTLLSLYRTSQFIYVGNFDRIEEGEMTEETEDYRVIPIKKYFSLSSSLKGETKKMLVLEESEYRYKLTVEEETAASTDSSAEETTTDAPPEAEQPEAVGEEGVETEVDDTELNPGDRVLLFLIKDEDSGELDLADSTDGLKKMTPESLSAYEPRIRELNQIFSRAEPSYSEIVAWIVRCAEDPHTRWEGTYELLRSFQTMDWQAERAKLAATKTDSQEEGETVEDYTPRTPEKFETGDENFAKALTEGEKLLLTNMLLSRERPKENRSNSSDDTAGMNRGDRELIELVKRWGDSRVAINLIEQLRYDSSDLNLNSELMGSIASILDDEQLNEIAERYSGIQWENEDDAVEEEDEQKEETETEQYAAPTDKPDIVLVIKPDAADEQEATEETQDKADEADSAESDANPEKEQPKKKTYGELRGELLKTFLERADRLIADKAKADENR